MKRPYEAPTLTAHATLGSLTLQSQFSGEIT